MIWLAAMAVAAGALVSLSRQINGRLALSTSALESAFWNHLVGAVALSLVALAFGGLFVDGTEKTPAWAYLGGTVGVVFIALSSWLITRVGAAQTAVLILAGQMVGGLALDLLRGVPGDLVARILGLGLVGAGVWLAGRTRR